MERLWAWTASLPGSGNAAAEGQSEPGPSSGLLASLQDADYATVLRSQTAQQMLQPFRSESKDVNAVALRRAASDSEHRDALLVASAALLAFAQVNWTGPDLTFSSAELLGLEGKDASQQLHSASVDALQWRGEPAYHLCKEAFLLVFAVRYLEQLASSPPISEDLRHLTSWWRLRAAQVHNRVLDEPVPFTQETMRDAQAAGDFAMAAAGPAGSFWHDIAARIALERGLALQRSGAPEGSAPHDASSKQQHRPPAELFVESAKLHGFAYRLSGALGKRTKFQRDDKTQLVLLARTRADVVELEQKEREREAAAAKALSDGSTQRSEAAENPERSGWQARAKEGLDKSIPSTYELNDDTLLEQTQFTVTAPKTDAAGEDTLASIDPNDQPSLSPFDQCILLALSLNIRNTSPSHGLTSEQIGAFVQRVLSHPMNWSVYTMALLLRSRLESTRTRTVERSVLQLQALVDQMPTADSSVAERLRLFFCIDLPPKWEMQAELARRYGSLGVTRSALEIFTAIEMWEDVVVCLGNLGRREEGIEVVRDLLEGRKVELSENLVRRSENAPESQRQRMGTARTAKLWCLLGDLEPASAEAHYKQAWGISHESSARAARSLGGIYFAKQRYADTIEWLRHALALNPLFSRSWFILGCAYMREEQWSLAAGCFRRCTNIDDEDGESWNNLASCYLRMGTEGPSGKPIENGKSAAADGQRQTSTNGHSSQAALPLLDDDIDLQGFSLEDEETEEEAAPSQAARKTETDTSYALRKLAHRALERSLKFSRDSWRVWYNFMVVSVDVGELRDAVRALGRVVEIRTSQASNAKAGEAAKGADAIDFDVLERLVDVVTRGGVAADGDEQGAAAAGVGAGAPPDDPNAARNLLRAVHLLFANSLLPRVHDSPRLWRAYARLRMWEGEYRAALDAYVLAWQCSPAGSSSAADAAAPLLDRDTWRRGIEELRELVELMENLGPKPARVQGPLADLHTAASTSGAGAESAADAPTGEAMPDWRFKARSLVRAYMARTKELFEDEPEWEQLVELRDELRPNA